MRNKEYKVVVYYPETDEAKISLEERLAKEYIKIIESMIKKDQVFSVSNH